jgi:uncharacterized integral membrane protein
MMKRLRTLVFALVAVLVIIVVLQNTQSVETRILLVTLSTPSSAAACEVGMGCCGAVGRRVTLLQCMHAHVAENKIKASDLIRRDPMINPQETRP